MTGESDQHDTAVALANAQGIDRSRRLDASIILTPRS